jgi:hypothetical protein
MHATCKFKDLCIQRLEYLLRTRSVLRIRVELGQTRFFITAVVDCVKPCTWVMVFGLVFNKKRPALIENL